MKEPTTSAQSPSAEVLLIKKPLNKPYGQWACTLKRIEDLLFSSVLIVLTTPVFLIITLAIKIETRGPVFFRQERYGLDGHHIQVFKFRSMHHASRDELCDQQTVPDDYRMTGVGAFLRRHSLDELPQLFNVLRGDMSLVGPRPHAVHTNLNGTLIEELVDDYLLRYRVKPGITGWAQVNGWRGGIDTLEKLSRRVEHDLDYIANWSLVLDIKIIVRTLLRIIHDEAAF